jgi:hypothetical protein
MSLETKVEKVEIPQIKRLSLNESTSTDHLLLEEAKKDWGVIRKSTSSGWATKEKVRDF